MYDVTEEDKSKIIERAQSENSPGAFLMIAYTKILKELNDNDMIDPNLVYISKILYSWILKAPKEYGFNTPEEDWSMFLVNKAPMAYDTIPENKIYWFESYEDKKQFEKTKGEW